MSTDNASETITLTNCAITGNTGPAGSGGGVSNFTLSGTVVLTNCAIADNEAAYGGGLANFNEQGGMTAITNCTISANTATKSDAGDGGVGGGVYNDNSYDSTSSTSGGTTTLTNCTTAHNSATNGGGIYNDNYYADGSTFVLTNCIVYGDTGGESYNTTGNSPVVSFCDIQGGFTGAGNINKDPLFVNAATGDLHLKPGSPCLGAGTPNGAPATDKDGRTRPNPPSIGAYELAATLTISPQYPTIQSAITAAKSGDTVMVPGGTFTGPGNVDWDFSGKNVTVSSINGAVIDCGGYPSTDGSGNHRGFYVHSDETTAVISGLTIRNGYESAVPGVPDSGYGAGLCVDGGSVSVEKCVFEGGTATVGGGGAAIIGKGHHSITFTNCVFRKSTAPSGGAVYVSNDTGTVTLNNCTTTKNTAQQGGGYFNQNNGGTIILTGCSVADNKANDGGGMYNENDASSGTITLLNCSVSDNAALAGSGIFDQNYDGSAIVLLNDIVYGDTGSEIKDNALSAPATTITYSDIQGGYPGIGNIDKDPQFVNAAGGDLHLKPGSPCLGAGTPDGAPATNLDGNPRPNPPSMGAYEAAAVPATITGFTLSPTQINAPGPTVTANVSVTGSFTKVTVSPAPGSLSIASPTFNLLTNSGGGWGGSFSTAFLKLAKTNPVTFIATGTRADGSTATMAATLVIGALPTLTFDINSDKSAVTVGQTFNVKCVVRNLTTAAADNASVTIPVSSRLQFVSSPDFKLSYSGSGSVLSWTGGPLPVNGSRTISLVFTPASDTTANTQISIGATASANSFQAVNKLTSVVVNGPPVPVGIDIDASGAAGEADGTAIITSSVGATSLQATISPVSGLKYAWLGVDYATGADGKPLAATTDVSLESLAASMGVVGPGLSPTYAASFPKIGSQCKIGLKFTLLSAELNIDSILLQTVGSLVGVSGAPKDVLEALAEFKKLQAFNAAANDVMKPASTPLQKTLKYAAIARDFININPNDLNTLAAYFSKKTGKAISAAPLKKALRVFGSLQGIYKIEQIVSDEIGFTVATGGDDAEVRFTGSSVRHPEQLR